MPTYVVLIRTKQITGSPIPDHIDTDRHTQGEVRSHETRRAWETNPCRVGDAVSTRPALSWARSRFIFRASMD